MYRAKLSDEDKWNIHSSGYSTSKYGSGAVNEKKYHEQKYGAKEGDTSSDYLKKEDSKDKDRKKEESFLESMDDEKKEDAVKDDEIQFKAAKQVFSENSQQKPKERRKDIDTIEDAIKKAIEDEKKVVVMDN